MNSFATLSRAGRRLLSPLKNRWGRRATVFLTALIAVILVCGAVSTFAYRARANKHIGKLTSGDVDEQMVAIYWLGENARSSTEVDALIGVLDGAFKPDTAPDGAEKERRIRPYLQSAAAVALGKIRSKSALRALTARVADLEAEVQKEVGLQKKTGANSDSESRLGRLRKQLKWTQSALTGETGKTRS